MEEQKKRANNPSILVDSDVFVALIKKDDTNHHAATVALKSLNHPSASLVTSRYVIAETLTVLSQRVNHAAAVKFMDKMRSPQSGFTIQDVTNKVEERADHIFRKQLSKNVSYIDCANMALMDILAIDYILSFDAAYRKNGYKML